MPGPALGSRGKQNRHVLASTGLAEAESCGGAL